MMAVDFFDITDGSARCNRLTILAFGSGGVRQLVLSEGPGGLWECYFARLPDFGPSLTHGGGNIDLTTGNSKPHRSKSL